MDFFYEVGQAWDEVRQTQKNTWSVESPKHQRKVEHLAMRAEDCGSHKVCHVISEMIVEKWKKLNEACGGQVFGDIVGGGEETLGCASKIEERKIGFDVTAGPVNPDFLLSVRYFSCPEDQERIDSEEVQIKRMAQSFNHSWKTKDVANDVAQPDEESEVVAYGYVELSENEHDLLSLGPGFMVVSPLDNLEMKVKLAVTLTKIRWSQKEGWN